MACGVFPDEGLDLRLLRWRVDSEPLDRQGSPASLVFSIRKLPMKQLMLGFCQVSQLTAKRVNPRPGLPTEREEGP